MRIGHLKVGLGRRTLRRGGIESANKSGTCIPMETDVINTKSNQIINKLKKTQPKVDVRYSQT